MYSPNGNLVMELRTNCDGPVIIFCVVWSSSIGRRAYGIICYKENWPIIINRMKKSDQKGQNATNAHKFVQNFKAAKTHKNSLSKEPKSLKKLNERSSGKAMDKSQSARHKTLQHTFHEYNRMSAKKTKERTTVMPAASPRVKQKVVKRKTVGTLEADDDYDLRVFRTPKQKNSNGNNMNGGDIKLNRSQQKNKQQSKSQNKDKIESLESPGAQSERLSIVLKCNQQNKEMPSPKTRYAKFKIRSQKYAKMMTELETERKHRHGTEKQISLQEMKPKSCFKKRVQKLNRQIEEYRLVNSKSETVLKKMEGVKKKEERKFLKQKKEYIQEIKRLEEQLREYRPNIGHLYTYKEYRNEKLVPECIIYEGWEQNRTNKKSQVRQEEDIRRTGQELVEQYLAETTMSSLESSVEELCLSTISNCSAK